MRNQNTHGKVSNPRRNILKWIWAGLGLVALYELCTIVFSFFRPKTQTPEKNEDKTTWVDAGPIDFFKPESVTTFVNGRFYLVQLKNGGILAMSSQCTHLGCSIPWNRELNKFICPCHASEFDITGKVLGAPAPRALDLYKVRITHDRVWVDTSTPIKRNSFSKGQLVFPENIHIEGKGS